MPRPLRFDAPGSRHHIMNRGGGHATTFVDDDDYAVFLMLIGEATIRFGLQVHGYALMTNHFHLMVESRLGRVSDAMAFILGRYTKIFNKRHGLDGALFRGRFTSRFVETTDYWKELLIYLHLNPVRARIVPRAEDSYLTSCRAYHGLPHTSPNWLHIGELSRMFGTPAELSARTEDVRNGILPDPAVFSAVDLWGCTPAPNIALVGTEVTESTALAELAWVLGDNAAVVVSSSTTGNPRAWITAWWLHVRAGSSLRAVAKRFRLRPPTISRWLPRLHRRCQVDEQVASWFASLNAILNASSSHPANRT